VWQAQFISELVGDFASAAIEEIVIDSRLDAGRASVWALRAGVPLVARVLNRMVAPPKAFDGNKARFGTSFVLYSGLISLATGNLSHRKLVVHDAMAHPADTSAIRVGGRFRARWLSYALLPQHAPLSTRGDMLFSVVDEAIVVRFLQLQTTGLCDSAPTSAHSILGWPVRGATPNTKTAGTSRHCHLPLALAVLSQVTVPNSQSTAHRRARLACRQLLQCFQLFQGANELSTTVQEQCRRSPPNPRLEDRHVFPMHVLDSLL